ncbi:MAG: tRNA lysidine(34) synthetase TilS, partial [Pseudomonadota bacterium]
MPRDAETRNADDAAPARDPAGAILDALAEALAPHAPDAPIIAAVSGGSDSTALLLALAEMRNVDPDTRARDVLVVTIDHDLRADSADDAVFVERLAARRGLTAETCVWRGDKPVAGLQAEARKARYAFLISEAERRWPGRQVLVLTAHTEEDQAETILMRLARGSGPAGLAAMTPWRRLKSDSDVRLLRPFLTLTRDDLRAFVASKGETWRDDPSNENDAFERIRWRKLRA